MSEKITINLFYMGILAAAVTLLISSFLFLRTVENASADLLKEQMECLTAAQDRGFSPQEISAWTGDEVRKIWLDESGQILWDSGTGALPEFSALIEQADTSEGMTCGVEKTALFAAGEAYCFTALQGGGYLWISGQEGGLGSVGAGALPMLALLLVIVLVMAVIFSLGLTRNIIKPIQELPAQMDDPLLAEDADRVYPELAPFVRQIQAQRHQQESMRQEFTANVTHELKTPLTTIAGYAEVIATGMAKQEDVQRFAEKIWMESERMQTLVNDIIELSKLDHSSPPGETEPVDLLETAHECADQLSASAEKAGVTLSVSGVSTVIMGEEDRLWELIYNLVDNAIRYNRPGGRVEVTVADREVTVKDNGIGIPEEAQSRVFERFYRVDKSHSRATGGTGLGLSIVKHIAEQYRAGVTLHSAVNLGTEICVQFPKNQ